jgi:hypothetical protein
MQLLSDRRSQLLWDVITIFTALNADKLGLTFNEGRVAMVSLNEQGTAKLT